MRILIIEDDKRLAKLVAEVLTDEHFNVDIAHDGNIGLEIAMRGGHDVIVVDWMLPGRDGVSICRGIRAAKLPARVLMLTARSMIEDRVAGLQSGADDYLVKPFAFEELIARIQALGRRDLFNTDPMELRVGSLVMDLSAQRFRRGNQVLTLTKTEGDLLEYFMRHPGQVLTRDQILDYVWSYDRHVRSTMVDVYVSYLRQKLDQPGLRDPLETIRGTGYRLEPKYA
ncbi:MAG: response regulator transcription factor [Anaerolineae bacterium]|nr:response regulator transcription factor [Anaerolineae bacterium]